MCQNVSQLPPPLPTLLVAAQAVDSRFDFQWRCCAVWNARLPLKNLPTVQVRGSNAATMLEVLCLFNGLQNVVLWKSRL